MTPMQTQKPKKFEKLANLFHIASDALKRKLLQPAVFGRQELALAGGYGAVNNEDIRSLFRKPMNNGGGGTDGPSRSPFQTRSDRSGWSPEEKAKAREAEREEWINQPERILASMRAALANAKNAEDREHYQKMVNDYQEIANHHRTHPVNYSRDIR